MNASLVISSLAMIAMLAFVSANPEEGVVVEGSGLSSAEQQCLNRAHSWMEMIPTTTSIEALYAQVQDLIKEEESSGNEVRLPARSDETTRDCGIYTSIIKAVLMFTQCNDDRTAYDIFNKLLTFEGDAYLDANQKFQNVFFHTVTCDAHVQTQLQF